MAKAIRKPVFFTAHCGVCGTVAEYTPTEIKEATFYFGRWKLTLACPACNAMVSSAKPVYGQTTTQQDPVSCLYCQMQQCGCGYSR